MSQFNLFSVDIVKEKAEKIVSFYTAYCGADDRHEQNQRYAWSVDDTSTDKNGVTHSGHAIKRGGALSQKTDSRTYCFFFAPFIHALGSEAKHRPAAVSSHRYCSSAGYKPGKQKNPPCSIVRGGKD